MHVERAPPPRRPAGAARWPSSEVYPWPPGRFPTELTLADVRHTPSEWRGRVGQQALQGLHPAPPAFLRRLHDTHLETPHVVVDMAPVDLVPSRLLGGRPHQETGRRGSILGPTVHVRPAFSAAASASSRPVLNCCTTSTSELRSVNANNAYATWDQLVVPNKKICRSPSPRRAGRTPSRTPRASRTPPGGAGRPTFGLGRAPTGRDRGHRGRHRHPAALERAERGSTDRRRREARSLLSAEDVARAAGARGARCDPSQRACHHRWRAAGFAG